MSETRVIEGELYVSVEAVAACYRVEAALLLEAHELGLVGRRVGSAVLVAARRLDRVAQIVRLHVHCGIGLEALFLHLDPEA